MLKTYLNKSNFIVSSLYFILYWWWSLWNLSNTAYRSSRKLGTKKKKPTRLYLIYACSSTKLKFSDQYVTGFDKDDSVSAFALHALSGHKDFATIFMFIKPYIFYRVMLFNDASAIKAIFKEWSNDRVWFDSFLYYLLQHFSTTLYIK